MRCSPLRLSNNATQRQVTANHTMTNEKRLRLPLAGYSSLSIMMLIGAFTVPAQAQPRSRKSHDEQSHFGAEVRVSRPVKLHPDVLSTLRKDKRSQTCLRKGQSPENIPSSWFVASAIHLDDDKATDVIVGAANPCLLGANIAPFWVFRNTGGGYQLVLQVETLSLDVLKSRTHGVRDIRTVAATANTTSTVDYSIDDGVYKPRAKPRE